MYLKTGTPSESVAGVNCSSKASMFLKVSSAPRVLLRQCLDNSLVVMAFCMALMEGVLTPCCCRHPLLVNRHSLGKQHPLGKQYHLTLHWPMSSQSPTLLRCTSYLHKKVLPKPTKHTIHHFTCASTSTDNLLDLVTNSSPSN